jgi:hypothetical protein
MTATELTPQNWFLKRSDLNHDWLRSELFLEVSALYTRCLGETSSSQCVSASICETLSDWCTRKDEVAALIKTCDVCTTPASAFAHPPLSRCEADVLEWLPALIHSHWLREHRIAERVLAAEQALQRAEDAGDALARANKVAECGSPLLAEPIDSFLVALTELSEAIGRLPHRILFA